MSFHKPLLRRGLMAGALASALALLPIGAVEPAWASGPVGSISPAGPIDFGSAPVNDGWFGTTVTIRNTGSAPLHITGNLTSSGPNPGDFPIDLSDCFSAVPVGGSCDVNLYFAPTALGTRTDTINIESDSSPAITATVTGVGDDGEGYYILTDDGSTYSYGNADDVDWLGDVNQPIVGAAKDWQGGFWEVATDGGVFAQDGSDFYGSMGGHHLNQPIVGMASTPGGHGYWLVAADGGIFSFGDAQFYGSTGSIRLNQPVVGMAATPTGHGYWLVASDGGIFSFGDAQFYGSTGSIPLNQPVIGMTTTPDGKGYRFVATDGGIFDFGDAKFYGSTGSVNLNEPIVGMETTATADGYYLVAADGGVFSFNAPFFGSAGSEDIDNVVAMVRS